LKKAIYVVSLASGRLNSAKPKYLSDTTQNTVALDCAQRKY